MPDKPSKVTAVYTKKVEYSARARTRGSTIPYKGVGRQGVLPCSELFKRLNSFA